MMTGDAALLAVAFLLTYLVHSTLWFAVAWLAARPPLGLGPAAWSRLWRLALVGPLASTALAVALPSSWRLGVPLPLALGKAGVAPSVDIAWAPVRSREPAGPPDGSAGAAVWTTAKDADLSYVAEGAESGKPGVRRRGGRMEVVYVAEGAESGNGRAPGRVVRVDVGYVAEGAESGDAGVPGRGGRSGVGYLAGGAGTANASSASEGGRTGAAAAVRGTEAQPRDGRTGTSAAPKLGATRGSFVRSSSNPWSSPEGGAGADRSARLASGSLGLRRFRSADGHHVGEGLLGPAGPSQAVAANQPRPALTSAVAGPAAGPAWTAAAPTWIPGPRALRTGVWTVLIVLAALALGRLVRLGVRHGRFQRRLGRRRILPAGEARAQLCWLAERARFTRPLRLSVSERAVSPMALGRGEVCLPARALEELEGPALAAVLAHEIGHLERRDNGWMTAAAIAEAIFFFQPLLRRVREEMEEAAELVCDQRAVDLTGSPTALARSIATVAAWHLGPAESLPVAAMTRGGSPVVRRVQALLEGAAPRAARTARARAATALLIGVGLLAPGVGGVGGPEPAAARIKQPGDAGVSSWAPPPPRAAPAALAGGTISVPPLATDAAVVAAPAATPTAPVVVVPAAAPPAPIAPIALVDAAALAAHASLASSAEAADPAVKGAIVARTPLAPSAPVAEPAATVAPAAGAAGAPAADSAAAFGPLVAIQGPGVPSLPMGPKPPVAPVAILRPGVPLPPVAPGPMPPPERGRRLALAAPPSVSEPRDRSRVYRSTAPAPAPKAPAAEIEDAVDQLVQGVVGRVVPHALEAVRTLGPLAAEEARSRDQLARFRAETRGRSLTKDEEVRLAELEKAAEKAEERRERAEERLEREAERMEREAERWERDFERRFGQDLERRLEHDLERQLGKDLGKKLGKDLGKELEKKFGKDFQRQLQQDLEKNLGKDLERQMQAWGKLQGQRWGRWGERLGRDMERWGRDVARQMEDRRRAEDDRRRSEDDQRRGEALALRGAADAERRAREAARRVEEVERRAAEAKRQVHEAQRRLDEAQRRVAENQRRLDDARRRLEEERAQLGR